MHYLVRHETVDKALEILADQYCRSKLLCFQETTEDALPVRDLATRIGPGEGTNETVVRLHHSTFPGLADAGLIEYDSRSSTVRYHEDQDVEKLLDALTDCFARGDEFCEVSP